jgi:hypothetical protein
MSHSDALSRLTVGDTKCDMIRWVLRRAIDTVEREWNYDASHIGDTIDVGPCAAWMVSRVTVLLASAALIGGFGLAAPAPAYASVQPAAASVYTMSPGRIAAVVAAVVGLIGAVIGGLALARSAGRIGNGTGRRGAVVAAVVGLIGLVIGGLVVAAADGGVGTGNGLGGGIVAMMVGLIGIALGGLALARSRRTA